MPSCHAQYPLPPVTNNIADTNAVATPTRRFLGSFCGVTIVGPVVGVMVVGASGDARSAPPPPAPNVDEIRRWGITAAANSSIVGKRPSGSLARALCSAAAT